VKLIYRLEIVTNNETFTFWSDLSGFKDLQKIREVHELNPDFKGSSIETIEVSEEIAGELLC